MKKLAAMIFAMLAMTGAAHAEQQIYNPYRTPNLVDPAVQEVREEQADIQQIGTLRVYPGREAYGRHFGPIPRHPGDYRDAVDRGAWVSGKTQVGVRSFNID